MPENTIASMFRTRVSQHSDAPALRHKTPDGAWEVRTWREYEQQVRALSRALAAEGVAAGDMVATISGNRPEYHITDLAILALGATAVPVYQTNSAEQVRYVLGDSGAVAVVCEDAEQCAKVDAVRHDLPDLKVTVTMSDGDADTDIASLIEKGTELDTAEPEAYRRSIDTVSPDDLACLIYTSGTTGPPKGVMLSHANVIWVARSLGQVIDPEPFRALSFLPLAHIIEREVSHYGMIYFGGETWFGGGIDTLKDDLVDCRPTVFFAVPRLYEKFEVAIEQSIGEITGSRGRLARAALRTGKRIARARADGNGPRWADRLTYPVLDVLVGRRLRKQAGLNRVQVIAVGAAPSVEDTIVFFHAIRLPVGEGYGLTECTGIATVNPPEDTRIGTVGRPIPGVEVGLADDNEILIRGGNVFQGYWNQPDKTAATMADDDWLLTGDLGALHADCYLSVTGRKKDLIITAGGKNIAPQNIESALRAYEVVSQAVVVGDGRKYLTALITLDRDVVEPWARERGLDVDYAEVVASAEVHDAIERAVDNVNADLAKAEQIKRFTILPEDFTQEEGLVTPTMKARRDRIAERYADEIEEMYR